MGNAPTSSLPKYNQAARIEIQTPQSEENCGTRVKFAKDKRNHQTYTLTPKMVVGELHPDDVSPKVIRNRTKPSAGLDEDEAKEEAAKYRSASEASIKPHTDVKDEYSGDKIPSKHNTLKEVDNI